MGQCLSIPSLQDTMGKKITLFTLKFGVKDFLLNPPYTVVRRLQSASLSVDNFSQNRVDLFQFFDVVLLGRMEVEVQFGFTRNNRLPINGR